MLPVPVLPVPWRRTVGPLGAEVANLMMKRTCMGGIHQGEDFYGWFTYKSSPTFVRKMICKNPPPPGNYVQHVNLQGCKISPTGPPQRYLRMCHQPVFYEGILSVSFLGVVWGSLGVSFQGMWAKSLNHGRWFRLVHRHSHHQLRHENDLKNSSTSRELNAQHVQNSGV